jgi:glucan phosphorylase
LPLDGAKVEIHAEVGEENIFIFGLKTFEVAYLKAKSYNSLDYYNANPELKHVNDLSLKGGSRLKNRVYSAPSSIHCHIKVITIAS